MMRFGRYPHGALFITIGRSTRPLLPCESVAVQETRKGFPVLDTMTVAEAFGLPNPTGLAEAFRQVIFVMLFPIAEFAMNVPVTGAV